MADSATMTLSEKKTATATVEQHEAVETLPLWNVLLHNDDVNVIDHVVLTLIRVCRMPVEHAVQRTLEAHNTGLSLVLSAHRERAELVQDQLQSCALVASIEPAA